MYNRHLSSVFFQPPLSFIEVMNTQIAIDKGLQQHSDSITWDFTARSNIEWQTNANQRIGYKNSEPLLCIKCDRLRLPRASTTFQDRSSMYFLSVVG